MPVYLEVYLKSGKAFLMANYFGHRTEGLTGGGERDYWSAALLIITL